MALVIKDPIFQAPAAYPEILNTPNTDAVGKIPSVLDQWYAYDGIITEGIGGVETFVWEGIAGKVLRGRNGLNERRMDIVPSFAAAGGATVLRSGWDSDAGPEAFDGNNERTQLITDDDAFANEPWMVSMSYALPASFTTNSFVLGNGAADPLNVYFFSASGVVRIYNALSDTLIYQGAVDYRTDAFNVFTVAWTGTEIVWRVNAVEVARVASTQAPNLDNEGAKFILGGRDSALGAAASGWYRGVVISKGAALMGTDPITGYEGTEADALAAIERSLMEDVGLTYPA